MAKISGRNKEMWPTFKSQVKSNHKQNNNRTRLCKSNSISTITMRRELKRLGLNSCVASKKHLSEANWGGERLQFAREHKEWTLEQWMSVMLSDELRFTLTLRGTSG